MAFSTLDRRSWIKRIYRKAVANTVSFKTQIETDLDAAVDGLAGGEILSISGNGLSTTFAHLNFSPRDAEQLLNSIDDLYTAAVADLASRATPVNSPTDAQILAAMLLLCVPVRRLMGDFTALRTLP